MKYILVFLLFTNSLFGKQNHCIFDSFPCYTEIQTVRFDNKSLEGLPAESNICLLLNRLINNNLLLVCPRNQYSGEDSLSLQELYNRMALNFSIKEILLCNYGKALSVCVGSSNEHVTVSIFEFVFPSSTESERCRRAINKKFKKRYGGAMEENYFYFWKKIENSIIFLETTYGFEEEESLMFKKNLEKM